MPASACCARIHHNHCLDVFSSSQHVPSLSEEKKSEEKKNREIFSFFLSLSLFSCIQSTTDDIIIIAYRHHFKTFSLSRFCHTLTSERNTSFSLCQILLVTHDETYEIKERKKMTGIKYGSMLSRTMSSSFLFHILLSSI